MIDYFAARPEMNYNIVAITTVIRKLPYMFQILRKIIRILADGIAPVYTIFKKYTHIKNICWMQLIFIPQYTKFNVDFKNISCKCILSTYKKICAYEY